MKRKYFSILTIGFVCCMLIACTSREESEMPETDSEIAYENSEQETVDSQELYLIWNDEIDNSVVLIDAISNERLLILTLDDEWEIIDIFNSNDGYFALFVAIPISEEDVNDENIFDFFSNFGDYVKYLILDEELNVIDELFITDERLLSNWFTIARTSYTTFVDGQLMIYYVEDQLNFFALRDSDDNALRRYNLHTGTIDILFEIPYENLFIRAIRKIDNETVFFVFNQSVDADAKFGFLDLTTEELNTFNESFDWAGWQDQFPFSGNHVLFNEAPDPNYLVPGQADNFVLARGEVLIINVETRQRHFVGLPGLESMHATLSLDGQYIVTIDDAFTFFRKYDVITGSLIFEQEVNIEGESFRGIVVLPTGDYELLSSTLLVDIVIDGIYHQEIAEYREIVRMNNR